MIKASIYILSLFVLLVFICSKPAQNTLSEEEFKPRNWYHAMRGNMSKAGLAKAFMNQWSKQGPAHHCAIGVGHLADKIEKLGQILDIDVVKVC